MQGTARSGWKWAPTAVATLVVGYWGGGGGTAGSGLTAGRLRRECRGGEGLKGR